MAKACGGFGREETYEGESRGKTRSRSAERKDKIILMQGSQAIV